MKLAKWTVSAVALAAIGLGSWQLVSYLHNQEKTGGTGHGGTPGQSAAPLPPTPTGQPVRISAVTAYNPLGTGLEHPDTAANAADGKPDTVWTTSKYDSQLGSWKQGTGLIVDLGSVHHVSAVHVEAVGGPTTVELRATAATVTGAAPIEREDLPAYGSALAKDIGTDLNLNPAHALDTRYLLIWLTDLPKDVDGKFQGRIAEIKVTG
ncbi:hypothetical protein [Kitasatospora sp. MMS16-BH015]|uniref:hypothetical protein n=1 Tax=Kitasatospora sp. MMS16-BH015 TaxID=2018025 RepID=UPI00131A5BD9|nr:hypothetical protein [Kitasatospora sp. MMS16-BH015]